jgi:hypothetical protein
MPREKKPEEWKRVVESALRPVRTERFTDETVPDERLEEPADELTYIQSPSRRELRLLRGEEAETVITTVELGKTPLKISLTAPVHVSTSVEPSSMQHSFRGFRLYWAELVRVPIGITPEGEVMTEEHEQFLTRRTYLTCRREKGEIHCRSVAGPPVSLPLEEWIIH